MFYFDPLLIRNGGNATGQVIQLTKTGRDDGKIHVATLSGQEMDRHPNPLALQLSCILPRE
jgi:hypothetical protein